MGSVRCFIVRKDTAWANVASYPSHRPRTHDHRAENRQRELPPPSPGFPDQSVQPFETDALHDPRGALDRLGEVIERPANSDGYLDPSVRKRLSIAFDPENLPGGAVPDQHHIRRSVPRMRSIDSRSSAGDAVPLPHRPTTRVGCLPWSSAIEAALPSRKMRGDSATADREERLDQIDPGDPLDFSASRAGGQPRRCQPRRERRDPFVPARRGRPARDEPRPHTPD